MSWAESEAATETRSAKFVMGGPDGRKMGLADQKIFKNELNLSSSADADSIPAGRVIRVEGESRWSLVLG